MMDLVGPSFRAERGCLLCELVLDVRTARDGSAATDYFTSGRIYDLRSVGDGDIRVENSDSSGGVRVFEVRSIHMPNDAICRSEHGKKECRDEKSSRKSKSLRHARIIEHEKRRRP